MRRVVNAVFFNRSPELVAPELLGKYLVRTLQDGTVLMGMITETEAYLPFDDPASHGFKRTKTRDSLYTKAGHAYVYALRHHFLFNTVTQDENHPGAVLIRGVQPVAGVAVMQRLRGRADLRGLTDGPGKLCQAFAIDRTLDGILITKRTAPVCILDTGETVDPARIRVTPRIGITKATDKLLRFVLA